MRLSLGIKLLELTKQRRRIPLNDLAAQLPVSNQQRLDAEIDDLVGRGLVSFADGVVELDTERRMRMADELVRSGNDPRKVSRFLAWQEFENFAALSLEGNGFRILKHFVFKGKDGRREIDLVAWSHTFLLAIDCKHWARGLSPSQARTVGLAQAERALALAEMPELLMRRGLLDIARRRVIPVVLCLGESRQGIVDGVPIVAISRLISFIYGLSPIGNEIRMFPFRFEKNQTTLA